PAAVPIPVDLGLVAEQLERHGHDDLSPLYLDVVTGGWVSSEPMAGVEDPPTDLDDDERYLPLVPYGRDEGWHDMELFIQSVQDPELAERLQRAIQGRGAFRYFADVAHHDDVEWCRWRRFSEERHLGRAREWLSLRDYRPDH
ncbi:MAG TPA: UPF0158 family protein, partial [Euzebya sp.]|nr:UPF0158 family protein [Euzebya sp.]